MRKMQSITIMGFLQNMWVKDPAKVQAALNRSDDPNVWEFWVKALLFSGCLTGKRIKSAFGSLADNIIYDECSKEIADNPKTICKPNPDHIKRSLIKHEPNIVIAFGNHAYKALLPFSMYYDMIIKSPHPAARQPDTIQKLRAIPELIYSFH